MLSDRSLEVRANAMLLDISPVVVSRSGFSMDRETADEIKRHFNVVAEGLRSEIRTVAEGLQGFREEVSAEFGAMREELGEVKAMYGSPSASSTGA
jgi:hypothetical protein